MTELVDLTHLDQARLKFTQLGDAIQDVSQRNTKTFDDLLKSLKGGVESTLGELGGEKIGSSIRLQGSAEAYTEKVAVRYENFAAKMGKSLDRVEGVLTNTQKSFLKLSDDARRLTTEVDSATVRLKDAAKDPSQEKKEDKGGKPTFAKRIVKKEVKTLLGRLKGMWSKLKLPGLGALAAGGIGIMIHGYLDKDRVRAEAGEMKNILIAAYDDGVRGAVGKGTSRLAGIQESLQKYMGLNRKEIQDTAQAFVDGGFSVTEMTRRVKTDLGGVHASAVTTTLALDKMFELAGGTSAKRMVDLMTKYGKSSDEARESLIRMHSVGRDSGVGAMQYVKNVEAVGDELSKMGYDIDNVVDIYSHVTKEFSKMGVPKQFAGRQAAMGIQQMAGGIAKMGDSWKIILGQRLGYGRGLEARQKMMDAFLRVVDKQDTNEVLKIVESVYGIAMEATGDDEETSRFYMERQMGLGFEGARLIAKIGKDMREGKVVEAAQAAKENSTILKKSFGVESKKRSQFELMMNSWMKGLAKVGQGLLGLALQTLAWLIAYFKALPAFIINKITGQSGANKQLAADIEKLFGNSEKHKARMTQGFGQMMRAMRNMGSDVLSGALQTLTDAANFDPTGKRGAGAGEGGRGGETDAGEGLPYAGDAVGRVSRDRGVGQPAFAQVSQPSAPTSQIVYLPMASLDSGESISARATLPVPEAERGVWDGVWAGGGISLEVGGVDTEGNIGFSIAGNCPRCGLLFGDDERMEQLMEEGAYDEDDFNALATMIASEVGRRRLRRGGSKIEDEAAGIGFTALNRLKQGGFGESLDDVITGGEGFGKQVGGSRPYSTERGATKESKEIARKLLSGRYEDPTGGAINFYHSQRGTKMQGRGFGGEDAARRTYMPQFTKGKVNTRNIGRASFWGKSGSVTQRAADAEEWRSKEEHAYRVGGKGGGGVSPVEEVTLKKPEKKGEEYGIFADN